MTPAQRLTKARLAAGLSQLEVATRMAAELGGSPASLRVTLARYETGTRTPEPRHLAVWQRAVGDADPDVPLVRLDVLAVVEPNLARWVDTYGGDATAAELRMMAAGAEVLGRVAATKAKRRKPA